jgi:hypothetical protein
MTSRSGIRWCAVNRAERRRAEREARRFRLPVDATCDRCGRYLDDGPPDAPTMSVDLGGSVIYACGHCAPSLRQTLELIALEGGGQS